MQRLISGKPSSFFLNFSFSQLFSQPKFLNNLAKTGLSPKLLTNITSDTQILSTLQLIFNQCNSEHLTKIQANLLCTLAQKMPPVDENCQIAIDKISGYILEGKIKENGHLDKILQSVKGEICQKGGIDWVAFEKKTGIDCEYSLEKISSHIETIIENNKDSLLDKKIFTNKNNFLCSMLRRIRNDLPGVNSQMIFSLFNEKLKTFCSSPNENTSNSNFVKNESNTLEIKNESSIKLSQQSHIWDKLKDLNTARDLVLANNTPEIFSRHWKNTQGRIFLRFPPEPNGFLHIGHAKAIRANFNSAIQLNGLCNLRFDDTNPEKESKEYIENIEKNILWLGYKPDKITHASDYFNEIYEFAVKLIKLDKAYICEQPKAELQSYRKAKKSSPFRDRSIEDNLKLFEQMKNGAFSEGSYCLRLKIDSAHVNPTMRDPVAYRIKNHPHPKTNKQWNIYPTYDFTHCISDSVENISHSLCTLEFEIRRDLYYWILDALHIFKPVVWEYSRLNISNNILSKRKLVILVNEGKVSGWDDPRLLTLEGLKRRGYTANSINEFCDLVNVTRRGNENIINIQLLEYCLRKELDKTAYRIMTVLDPVLLVIENMNDNEERIITIPIHQKDQSKGDREIKLSKRLFIEKKDVRVNDETDFFGLALNKIVFLKYVGFIQCMKIIQDPKTQAIKEVHVKLLEENKMKIKGVIHWISEKESRSCEVRLFENLFKVEDPNSLEDFKTGLNEESKIILNGCKLHTNFTGNEACHYQFERTGYFVLDKESKIEKKEFIFNMSVGLKENKGIKSKN